MSPRTMSLRGARGVLQAVLDRWPRVRSRSGMVVALGFLTALVAGVNPAARADEADGDTLREPLPLSTILSSPDRYSERKVVIRGEVAETNRAVFPNGRVYYTLSVVSGPAAITVFSWVHPWVERGDLVEVVGVFHIWRYNLRHVIEGSSIIKVPPSTSHDPAAGVDRRSVARSALFTFPSRSAIADGAEPGGSPRGPHRGLNR